MDIKKAALSTLTLNIMIVGLGGQGVILVSDLIAQYFIEIGFQVKKSEIHGMSQRGGPVSSHIRIGHQVYSPMISMGECHYLLSFDDYEEKRALCFLRKDGVIIKGNKELLRKLPNIKTRNILYLALLFKQFQTSGTGENSEQSSLIFSISKQELIDFLKNNISKKIIDDNLQAVELAYNN